MRLCELRRKFAWAVVALLLVFTAACSRQPAGEPPPTVIPSPADLSTAENLVQRIDASLSAWQQGQSELVDYSGEGGEMVFWFDNETVRKIEATLLGESGQAHWQVYYTSEQKPFYAIYRETLYDSQFGNEQTVTLDSFVLLKNSVLHRAGNEPFAPVDAFSSPPVSPDEVRAFGLQLVQSVQQDR